MHQNTIIIGNLGGEPKMRYTPSGVAVASFPVATNRRWKDANGETQERTTWFRVTAWRKLAETCNQFLTKGRLVMVEGEVAASAWVSKDGEARATLELTAKNIRFLGKGNGHDEEPATEAPEIQELVPAAAAPEFNDSDLPF